MGAVELLGAVTEHLDEAGFVEHRVGVGRDCQAGHAAGHRGLHFRFEGGAVLETRLAQARGKVHQARAYHEARGVDRSIGGKTLGALPTPVISPSAM